LERQRVAARFRVDDPLQRRIGHKSRKQATASVPIVLAPALDPVGLGLVASLSHPGGNVTALSLQASDAAGKRLELLRDTVASRFIKVAFARSFAGKEDVNLRSKLTPELPGIAVRCLAAYRRLLRRGYFIQPQSAADLEAQIEEQANGFLQFMNECFEADAVVAAKGV
jgi:ABC transporter substrate binding protein